MQHIEIRPEDTSDIATIRAITISAFRDRPYAGGDEQDVIDRLRSASALSVSLVAVIEQEILGHIAFSPAQLSDASQPWFALGPVSVLPTHQGQGIGSAMIERGLGELRKRDALGCILTGNPQYYRRFGFELSPQNVPANESAEYFMLKLLAAVHPSGKFAFHRAFYEDT
jgi:putative acetyltransferase